MNAKMYRLTFGIQHLWGFTNCWILFIGYCQRGRVLPCFCVSVWRSSSQGDQSNLRAHVSLALADESGHAPIQTDFPMICYGPGQSQPFIWHGVGLILWPAWPCQTKSQIFPSLSAPSHISLLWLVRSIKLCPEGILVCAHWPPGKLKMNWEFPD